MWPGICTGMFPVVVVLTCVYTKSREEWPTGLVFAIGSTVRAGAGMGFWERVLAGVNLRTRRWGGGATGAGRGDWGFDLGF